ncbi:hypothetical protein [Nocardia wallacei]|uniref:hypothetical protein n=1 Tax=Nocardia wallacei TaxID=480035 RepID=UPI002453D2A2|nr:hypothetical protein [Nocardia wallacei]
MSELDVWRQLADEVAHGNLTLRVTRENLDTAVRHLQDYIDALDTMRPLVNQVATADGFGTFDIGEQLAAKYTEKGSGAAGIAQRLRDLAAEAVAIQDTLRKAAAAYTETEQQAAAAIGGAGEQS